jgi:phosphate-selective porin OprO and OprP
MRKIFLLGTAAMVAASFAAMPAYAERKAKPNRDAEIQELKERIERLEAEAADDKIANGTRLARLEKITDDVQWSFNDLRPMIRTGDGRFEMAFRGRVQLDFAHFEQDPNDFGVGYGPVGTCQLTNVLCDQGSGAVFRRVRFGVEGKFFRDFIYELRFDFGGSGIEGSGVINIARVGYVGIPGLRIQAGAIQPIMTMYDATSSAELTTMERAAVITTLVGNFGGDNARRGVEVTYQKENFLWDGDNFLLTGAFTGERAAQGDHSGIPGNDESTYALGRLAYRLWSDGTSNIQIGGTYAHVLNQDDNIIRLRERPEIRVTGDRFIDTGNILVEDGSRAYGAEFGMNWENLYLAGEYYMFELDRQGALTNAEFDGYYVEGEWILTGENKRYVAGGNNNNQAVFRGPSIAAPWSPGGGIGAWSLHARHSVLDLNYNAGNAGFAVPAAPDLGVRGGKQTVNNVGITWYINNNFKMQGEYAMVEVDRLNAAGQSLNADFDIIQTRMMFTF